SSSLKFQLVDAGPDGERRLARGLIDGIGGAALATLEADGHPARRETATVADHGAAVATMLTWLGDPAVALAPPAAVGHRIVHGGARFTQPVRLTDAVVAALADLQELAPLHNAPGVAGI